VVREKVSRELCRVEERMIRDSPGTT
jgi:hypothetical protein